MTDLTGRQHLLCLQCGVEMSVAPDEYLDGCPLCGDHDGVPADLGDTVTVTLSRHELRVLTFWADGYARTCVDLGRAKADRMPKVVRTIVDRLGRQTDTSLTLSQEIDGLRAAFPGSDVKVIRNGKVAE